MIKNSVENGEGLQTLVLKFGKDSVAEQLKALGCDQNRIDDLLSPCDDPNSREVQQPAEQTEQDVILSKINNMEADGYDSANGFPIYTVDGKHYYIDMDGKPKESKNYTPY